MAEGPCRDDVFPFCTFRAAGLLPDFIPTGLRVHPSAGLAHPCPIAAAVEVTQLAICLVEKTWRLATTFASLKLAGELAKAVVTRKTEKAKNDRRRFMDCNGFGSSGGREPPLHDQYPY